MLYSSVYCLCPSPAWSPVQWDPCCSTNILDTFETYNSSEEPQATSTDVMPTIFDEGPNELPPAPAFTCAAKPSASESEKQQNIAHYIVCF